MLPVRRTGPGRLISTLLFSLCFFSCEPAATDIYTLSLHDALPISTNDRMSATRALPAETAAAGGRPPFRRRSEEHTSELQSRPHLVCRLLLEKKKRRHV